MRLLPTLIAALTLAAGAQASAPAGTLAGLVTRGPITPVCAFEQPCDAPAPHVTLLFTRNGSVARRVVTDASGRYAVRLAPGTYSVSRSVAAAPDRKLEPNRVHVVANRRLQLDFSIDTGIR